MLAFFVVLTTAGLVIRSAHYNQDSNEDAIPKKLTSRLGRLWDIAHQSILEKKYLRAEKALLTILKMDEKNAAAYNRLGILYAKQKEFRDAIECFEVASSLEPSASSLHNLGLIYYETENYSKSAIAFEEALKLDDTMAARHIAYAKANEKLGNKNVMLKELEKAVELEPNHESYSLLLKAYETEGMDLEAAEIASKISRLISSSRKTKRIARPRRVIM
jgi:tetratricopeptide (TPR) repeat protein